MGITISLSKLREFFKGWHEAEYYQIHYITDEIYSDRNNVKSKYAFSSYGASKIQAQIGNINLNNYVTKTTYNNHVDNQKGTKNTYGHVKLIDDLTKNTYTDGDALSAHQGYELNQKILSNGNKIQNIENQFMDYKLYVGRIGLKATPNTPYPIEEVNNMLTSEFLNKKQYYGLYTNQKLQTLPGCYIFALVVDKNNNGVGNQRVVIELNGVPYSRVTAANGVAAVQLKWGFNTDEWTRRNWSDRWRWAEVTILPTEDKYIDKSIHKVINHDAEWFDYSYNPNHPEHQGISSAERDRMISMWRSELGLKDNETQDKYMHREDGRDKLRRKIIDGVTGYPNTIE